jgi:hypothetical protein
MVPGRATGNGDERQAIWSQGSANWQERKDTGFKSSYFGQY